MNNQTQVDNSTCSASGCPMLATHSRGTTGENWLCFIHAAAQQGAFHRHTLELQRLHWLVDIVRRLRAGAALSADHHQAFVLAQRGDLKRKPSEDMRAWMIRLEGVLQQSCKDSEVQA